MMMPWDSGGLPEINVAMTCVVNDILGPGNRFVVWVQGCFQSCEGCISRDWRSLRIAHLLSPETLAQSVIRSAATGLTLSGGEPMLQAAGLAQSIRNIRLTSPISVICFTGYTIEELQQSPPGPGVQDLLSEVDLLIDSPYIQELNNNRGLRGSTNQRFIPLTGRFADKLVELEAGMRRVEVQIVNGGVIMVGVPPAGVAETFNKAIDNANELRDQD